MTYVEDLTTPATGDAAMRRVKTHAVAQGWVVAASGDGRSAYGASSDVISADSGAGSLDTSGAWMRLRMGGGATREVLIVRKSTSVAWTVRYSAAGFSGGSPSATTAPTATDSQTLIDGTLLPTDGTYRWLICAEDGAPYYLGAYAIPSGGGTAQTLLGLWPMRTGSYPNSDTDPYAMLADYHASDVGKYTRLITVNAGSPQAWSRPGLSSSAFSRCQFAKTTAVTEVIGVSSSMVHAISAEELPLEIPALLIDSGPVYRGPKGYVRDARYCMTPVATTPHGTHLAQGSRYWVRVGDLWLPWGSTPPSL